MSALTLAKAETIASAALAKGREMNFAPLTVVVLDAGGHITSAKREDGSGILRIEIAKGKAWGALGMGFGTRNLAGRAAKMPAFFAALAAATRRPDGAGAGRRPDPRRGRGGHRCGRHIRRCFG